MTNPYPKQFLDIQVSFAEKASQITHLSLEKSLFVFTSLPVRFGIPFSELSEGHPVWEAYLEQIENENIADNAYQFYLHREKVQAAKSPQFNDRSIFGCFSYNLVPWEKGLRLHFSHKEAPEPGALSQQRRPARLQELKDLFRNVKFVHPEIEFVVSSSWLYNVGAFARLFPPEFISSKQVVSDYHSLGVWGQFLNKYEDVKEDLARQFLENTNQAISLEGLEQAFPMPDLKLVASIDSFCHMYAV